MQEQPRNRRTSGAKAVAIDPRALIVRYRLLQLFALILSAVLALGLHFIFAR
jgi:hypothetical protein